MREFLPRMSDPLRSVLGSFALDSRRHSHLKGKKMKLKVEGMEAKIDQVTTMLKFLAYAVVGLALAILGLAVRNAH